MYTSILACTPFVCAPTPASLLAPAEHNTVCGSITRADVADLVVKALRSDKTNGKVLSAVDSAVVQAEAFTC
ncbi:hypothetical protein ABPG75_002649 [Micractinium tetrahymenae]